MSRGCGKLKSSEGFIGAEDKAEEHFILREVSV